MTCLLSYPWNSSSCQGKDITSLSPALQVSTLIVPSQAEKKWWAQRRGCPVKSVNHLPWQPKGDHNYWRPHLNMHSFQWLDLRHTRLIKQATMDTVTILIHNSCNHSGPASEGFSWYILCALVITDSGSETNWDVYVCSNLFYLVEIQSNDGTNPKYLCSD